MGPISPIGGQPSPQSSAGAAPPPAHAAAGASSPGISSAGSLSDGKGADAAMPVEIAPDGKSSAGEPLAGATMTISTKSETYTSSVVYRRVGLGVDADNTMRALIALLVLLALMKEEQDGDELLQGLALLQAAMELGGGAAVSSVYLSMSHQSAEVSITQTQAIESPAGSGSGGTPETGGTIDIKV
ncbi:MAG: hypothetical protein IID36_09230 [Planctomycetes bacterium]|nr:hypothetical protein [Planctomycetota bacterium]